MNYSLVRKAMALLIVVVCACKKSVPAKTDCPPAEANASSANPDNYTMLKPGNYWIYRRYTVANGTTSEEKMLDSCYVEKDTLIRGFTYHKYKDGFTNSFYFLRDSLHYLVTFTGEILFSSEEFNSILSSNFYIDNFKTPPDTLYKSTLKMDRTNPETVVPAGIFRAYDAIGTYHINKALVTPENPSPKYTHARYAPNIGLVYDTHVYLSVSTYTERKLVRYRAKQ